MFSRWNCFTYDTEIHETELCDAEIQVTEVHERELHETEFHDTEIHETEIHDTEIQVIEIHECKFMLQNFVRKKFRDQELHLSCCPDTHLKSDLLILLLRTFSKVKLDISEERRRPLGVVHIAIKLGFASDDHECCLCFVSTGQSYRICWALSLLVP